MKTRSQSGYRGKRTLDLVTAVVGMTALLPFLVVIALLVRLFLGSPVLFVQKRAGLNGQPFEILKFRSMTNERSSSGILLPADQRLTPFGRMLRSTSLDELPQLWNVVRGDISLVGPRPLHLEYVPLYDAEQARRLTVRPGITGLAQVSGRSQLSWEQRFELDVKYVDSMSFVADVRIILRTAGKMLKREATTPAGKEIMDRFMGSNKERRRGE